MMDPATQYNLGPVAMIPPGEGRVFRIGCADIAVFHSKAGDVYATQPQCPHRDGPLADGITGSGHVVCPLHGYKFDLTSGRPVGNDCEALQTYWAMVSDSGEILVSVSVDSNRIPEGRKPA